MPGEVANTDDDRNRHEQQERDEPARGDREHDRGHSRSVPGEV
jgi:hypothetical protein